MGQLSPQGSKYSDAKRQQAIIGYALSGNAAYTGREINVPKNTVIEWTKQSWFIDALVQVRAEKSHEHIAQYTQIVDKAQAQTLLELPNATAAQASIIAATATDKAQLLMGLPTSIRADSSTVNDLAKQFEQLSRDHRNIQSTVVSEQHKEQSST